MFMHSAGGGALREHHEAGARWSRVATGGLPKPQLSANERAQAFLDCEVAWHRSLFAVLWIRIHVMVLSVLFHVPACDHEFLHEHDPVHVTCTAMSFRRCPDVPKRVRRRPSRERRLCYSPLSRPRLPLDGRRRELLCVFRRTIRHASSIRVEGIIPSVCPLLLGLWP